jgi:hypothetical protein
MQTILLIRQVNCILWLEQQSRRRYTANGFAFVPIRAVLDASQTPRSDLTT